MKKASKLSPNELRKNRRKIFRDSLNVISKEQKEELQMEAEVSQQS